jgi:RNA polymerase sigma factor (sigma-70 family)
VTEAAHLDPLPETRLGPLRLLSDERLARRAAHGDRRAFEAIYARYHQQLYRFCLAMVGNPQDAQDALQNAMVKVLRALPGEQREIRLKPWLYRIARNESVETLRRRRDAEVLEPEQIAGGGVAETAEVRERLRSLLADLEHLPERQRAALVMRELAGLDFDEIGATFGSSAAVARQTLYEARLSLRQLEAGREMRCEEVMRELSDADGRVTRRREIRAHLRGCADCRAFREGITKRGEDLVALAPLPLAVSAGLLQSALGGTAGAAGAAGGKAIATATVVKSVATVAVATVVGVSAADRGGLVDVPLPGDGGRAGGEGVERVEAPALDTGTAASRGAVSGQSAGGAASGGGDKANGGSEGRSRSRDDAARRNGSSPAAGLTPPGEGHGRSASTRRGRPEQLPKAANRGQQTAAAGKPAAASPPGRPGSGHGRASGNQGSPPVRLDPPARPAPRPKAKAPATLPSAPRAGKDIRPAGRASPQIEPDNRSGAAFE